MLPSSAASTALTKTSRALSGLLVTMQSTRISRLFCFLAARAVLINVNKMRAHAIVTTRSFDLVVMHLDLAQIERRELALG